MGAAYLVAGSTTLQQELGVDCTQQDAHRLAADPDWRDQR